ncbi:PREDICTED: uncharacterized protein LOC109474678 [Branchiostoma belcheri]|uniref:Uncharacterized protein LOC109474678 n=1 Tax=Branchiostoma belcheri TaxID=7741 RepID=A0A6P4Z231_BRABE|nr:PREDICTED: uncharacterized protein LOC109474678 [Branchiostoma belcheri]
MMKNLLVKSSGVYTFVAEKVANTTLTTQADIHQYSNDDTPGHSGDTEEGQDHIYASAAPPPLPVCDDEDNLSPGATGPCPLQAAHSWDSEEGQDHLYTSEDNKSPEATVPYPLQSESGQTDSQIDEIESDEEERPYGMATENPVYEDTNLSQSNPTPPYCAVDSNQVETNPSVSRNSLYGQQLENTNLNQSNPTQYYCAANANQVETTSSLGVLTSKF